MSVKSIPLFSTDMLAKKAEMTNAEFGQYMAIIFKLHAKGEHITDSEFKRIAGRALPIVLDELERDSNGLLYSPLVDAITEKQAEHSKKQSVNALKRWGDGNANAMQSQCERITNAKQLHIFYYANA